MAHSLEMSFFCTGDILAPCLRSLRFFVFGLCSFQSQKLLFNTFVDEGTQGDVRDGADAVFGSRRDEDVDALVMGLIVIVAVFALT